MVEKTIKSNELLDVLRNMSPNALFNFFFSSCKEENLELCQLCLDAGASINIRESTPENNHYTLLMKLLTHDKLTITTLDWFIKKNADLNASLYNKTALSYACYYGNFHIVKHLINNGASIFHYTNPNPNHSDLTFTLYGSRYYESQHVEIVKLLLEKGLDLNSSIQHDRQVFYDVLSSSNTNMKKFLLQEGISPDIYNHHGYTLLHKAVIDNNLKEARFLLDYNANVNISLKNHTSIIYYLGITPMDIAVFNQNTTMQKLLSEFGGRTSSKEEKVNALLKYCNANEISSIIKKILTL